MKLNELISIIIPVYNVEKYLERCIESVINQTLKNIEIILVNDGSTDSSPKICDYYASIDNRIKVIHKKNEGVGSARNTGLDVANGLYIGFLDSDDYVDKNMYKVLYENLNKRNVDICVCDFEYITKEDKSLYSSANMKGLDGTYNSINFLELLYKGQHPNAICVWNKLYKKEVFKNIKFKNITHEDEEVCHRIYTQDYKVYVSTYVGYKYIENPNSITNQEFSIKELITLDILNERINLFKKYNLRNLLAQTIKLYLETNIYFMLLIKEMQINYDVDLYKKKYKVILKSATLNRLISLKDKVRFYIFYINPKLYKLLVSYKNKN